MKYRSRATKKGKHFLTQISVKIFLKKSHCVLISEQVDSFNKDIGISDAFLQIKVYNKKTLEILSL